MLVTMASACRSRRVAPAPSPGNPADPVTPSSGPRPAARARPVLLWTGVVLLIHISFYAPTFNLADVWLRGGILIAAFAWLWNRPTRPTRPMPQRPKRHRCSIAAALAAPMFHRGRYQDPDPGEPQAIHI